LPGADPPVLAVELHDATPHIPATTTNMTPSLGSRLIGALLTIRSLASSMTPGTVPPGYPRRDSVFPGTAPLDGCPGTKGAGTCSGIKQPTWYFSHTFEPFSR
jgi:hypothetical protein